MVRLSPAMERSLRDPSSMGTQSARQAIRFTYFSSSPPHQGAKLEHETRRDVYANRPRSRMGGGPWWMSSLQAAFPRMRPRLGSVDRRREHGNSRRPNQDRSTSRHCDRVAGPEASREFGGLLVTAE